MTDLDTWIDLTFTRYLGSLGRRPENVLADLRRDLRAKADAYRASFRSRAGRLWAAQRLDEVLGKLLADELGAGDFAKGDLFGAIENLKARTLLDQMGGRFKIPREPEAVAKLLAMEREVMRFAPSAERDPGDQLAFEELRHVSRLPIGTPWDRSDRREALDRLERTYADLGCGFDGVEAITRLEDVQRLLSPRELLLEYHIPFHLLHPAIALTVLSVTADACEVDRFDFASSSSTSGGFIGSVFIDGGQPLDASPLGSAIVSARTAIQAGDDAAAREPLRSLYGLLIPPICNRRLAAGSIDRIILVPHGMLHVVPFGALATVRGRYLAEEVALTAAPSATIWQRLSARPRAKSSAFLGLGNPRPKTRPLEASEREVEEAAVLSKSMACTVLTRERASKEALRQHVSGKNILHFATHGEFPELDAIDFHRIILAEGVDGDGTLDAEDVRNMDLNAVYLAVLSICNGGLYRYGPGDEPYGLIPAFLIAGVQNVISTLWPLEDRFGRTFMKELYAGQLTIRPAQALQQSVRRFAGGGLFRRAAKLRQWASFVLVGAGHPFD